MHKNIILTEPIGYIDFISLIKNSSLVITDSRGIREETTFPGVQCITTRKTTERPITVDIETNTLIGEDFEKAYKLHATFSLEKSSRLRFLRCGMEKQLKEL